MKPDDNTFIITIKNPSLGAAPLAHLDSLTEVGQAGHYSTASNVDVISKPGLLTQGPALATLTDGDQAGAVTELINFILDRPVAADVTYGISATKLHKITPSAVINTGSFPHAITSATSGNSVIEADGYLYYFYNKASGADCGRYDLNVTFDDDYMSTVPTGAAALQSAPHPVAKKQDIILFGNGRYVGTFITTTATLAPTRLDFKANTEVADVCFDSNQWWIAVNSGITTGTNRASSQIYLYDGAALSSLLSDEVAVGLQQIGFIYPINGIKFVAYKDLSSAGGYCIGYVSGRSIKPLRYFTGTLPTFAQKTLYYNTLLFISNGLVYSCGAPTPEFPNQISQLADGGYSTVGAIAAPFGVPMIASSQSSSFKLAKFSGYDINCSWKSIVMPLISGTRKGYIDTIIVLTKTLGASASCALTIEGDQASQTSSVKTITGTGKRRHVLRNFALNALEDFRIALNWSGGSASNDCAIRQIQILGHWVESS
jgi:hypothetical protein